VTVGKHYIFAVLFALAGCTGINSAMTPGAEVIKDDFYGATVIRQSPISASSSLSEPWHTLGFEWSTKTLDKVYVTAGLTMRTESIQNVEFKADDQIIEHIEIASNHTEFENSASTRRFSMPLTEFRKIASAKDVKMKITHNLGNDYSVSSFGLNNQNALVNSKFAPFLNNVDELMTKKALP
jgi:hypothetical protein